MEQLQLLEQLDSGAGSGSDTVEGDKGVGEAGTSQHRQGTQLGVIWGSSAFHSTLILTSGAV
jgi:hypothetical protein